MVFYKSILPTELWLIIYKIEHIGKFKSVNNQIKNLFLEKEKITNGIKINVKKGGYLFDNLMYYIYSFNTNTNFDITKQIKIAILKGKILLNKQSEIWSYQEYVYLKNKCLKDREIIRRLTELKKIEH